MIPRRALAAALAIALLAVQPGVAAAHAEFVRAEPAANAVLDEPPAQVQVWFSEPIEPGFSEIEVVDATRQRVDAGLQTVPGDQASLIVALQPLEQGSYSVRWRVLSAVDGHVTRGVFSLSVGVEATAPPPPPSQAASPVLVAFEATQRWLSYLAATALLGALLFRLLVLQPSAQRLGLAATLTATRPGLERLAWGSLIVLALAHLEALALQLALVSPDAEGAALRAALGQLLVSTRYGAVWLARLGLLAALAALFRWRRHDRPPQVWWGATALGAALLLTHSLNSHSASVEGFSVAPLVVDWLHLMAVAVWIGGLFSLALVLPAGLKVVQADDRTRLLATLVPRFSTLAIASVATLVGTGLFSAWLHVGSFGALVETLYGQSLLVKLALVLPLFFLGAINLRVSRPRLVQAIGGAAAPAARLAQRFQRLVVGEVVLAILVLAATGLLTSLPPARQAFQQLLASRPLTMTTQARGLDIDLSIAPARPGINTFTLEVRDAAGRPVDDAERVDLRFTYLDEAVGTAIERTTPLGEGRYQAQGAFLGVEGRWQIETLVRQPGQEDVLSAFRFRLSAEGATAEQPTGAQAGLRLPAATPTTALALGLVVLGLGLIVYISRGVGLASTDGRLLALASLLVVGLGGYLLLRPQVGGLVAAGGPSNPIAPTEASLATGRMIYRTHCQSCHGPEGRGDGPAAAALSPRPADLRVHMQAGHTDAQIFGWVSDGMPGTAMPAFADQLTEEERWHVINFIKSLALSSD